MWRRLGHPNVLPLLGVNIDCFQLISSWMPGGRLPDYVKKHSNPDRLGLVNIPPVVVIPRLLPLPAVRRREGPLVPPLLQCRPWGPQGST